MENLRFTKTDFSWCGLVIVEVSSVEKERKKCIDFRWKFMISFKNAMLQFLRRKSNIYALKHLKRFFRQLIKNLKIVGSKSVKTWFYGVAVIWREKSCARDLKLAETEVTLRGFFMSSKNSWNCKYENARELKSVETEVKLRGLFLCQAKTRQIASVKTRANWNHRKRK